MILDEPPHLEDLPGYGVLLSFGSVVLFAVICQLAYCIKCRERERHEFFINLLETALLNGHAVEHAILSAAKSRDLSMGKYFYAVAGRIEQGMKLSEAIRKEARYLPRPVSELLSAGERMGDIKLVLPACHEMLKEAQSTSQVATDYVMMTVGFCSVFIGGSMAILNLFVIPRFQDIANGMKVVIPSLATTFFGSHNFVIGAEVAVILVIVMVNCYTGGAEIFRWLRLRDVSLGDWIAWHVPWRQKRLLRTFSLMLGTLLDRGMTETDAVRLAADCTGNGICCRRARQIDAKLEQGNNLADAVQSFDDSGELHWRLTNATHARGKFMTALTGWHEALAAKAAQQEVATTCAIISGMVIANGLIVALLAIAIYGILVSVMDSLP